ncbi:hypothetical protein L6Q96_10065 [Candidatus Binatia bacterium]|nr:hypothetical protein [Candidatus Binatia bacterium]
MRQLQNFGRIVRRVGMGAAAAAALAFALAGGGCGGDDEPPVDNQCLAEFEVSPETCEQMQVFLNCGKRSWTAPNNCSLSKCDCATGTNCNYVFELANQNDCGGVWLTLMCLTQKWEQNQGRQDGTCTMTQCLCFTPPPTPVPTRTPTPQP